jgi:hypothetical protein
MPRNHDCTASFRSRAPLSTHTASLRSPPIPSLPLLAAAAGKSYLKLSSLLLLASTARSSSLSTLASLSSHSTHSHSSNPRNGLSPSILSLSLFLCVDVSIVGAVWCDQDRLLCRRCSRARCSLCRLGLARSLCGVWCVVCGVWLVALALPLSCSLTLSSLALSLPLACSLCCCVLMRQEAVLTRPPRRDWSTVNGLDQCPPSRACLDHSTHKLS